MRRFLPDLIGRITRREIDPGRVFDLTLPLDGLLWEGGERLPAAVSWSCAVMVVRLDVAGCRLLQSPSGTGPRGGGLIQPGRGLGFFMSEPSTGFAGAPRQSSAALPFDGSVRLEVGTVVDNSGAFRAEAVPVRRFPAFVEAGMGASPSWLVFCVDTGTAFTAEFGVVGDLRLRIEPSATANRRTRRGVGACRVHGAGR